MKPHEQRVVDEKSELDAKHRKLAEFIDGSVYPTLDEVDQLLLVTQLDLMIGYSNVLKQRLARFPA